MALHVKPLKMKPLKVKELVSKGKQLAQDHPLPLARKADEPTAEDIRVTNETVAARREEVLKGARKYIYPLQASKRRIVKLSIAIFATVIIGFSIFCLLELYRFQSTSSFISGVTQVVPFPVAVIDKHPVSYNDYLFELRHYMHYYETQQHANFDTKDGQQELGGLKEGYVEQGLENGYVQQLAAQNNISVSSKDIDTAVELVRSQNRLGASDQVFQNVLSEFWGWSVDDFRRELSSELLAQKVADKLDIATHDRANLALQQLQAGADFATEAKQASDDTTTKANGGSYGIPIDKSNADLAPQVIEALFNLSGGQYSGIVNAGYSLEIVKVIDVQGSQLHAAHMSFNFQPITAFTAPIEKKEPAFRLVHV